MFNRSNITHVIVGIDRPNSPTGNTEVSAILSTSAKHQSQISSLDERVHNLEDQTQHAAFTALTRVEGMEWLLQELASAVQSLDARVSHLERKESSSREASQHSNTQVKQII